jgi:hypothetical protein
MKCPRCGVFNPPSAQRCDCGYDFTSGTVQRSYLNVTPQLPTEIKIFLTLVVALNIVVVVIAVTGADVSRIAVSVVWSLAVYWLYWRMVNRDNWARIALVVLTFPLGLLTGLLSHQARLYCLQKPTAEATANGAKMATHRAVLKCPECASPYDPADYSPDAKDIWCSLCHARLPTPGQLS